MNWFRQNRELGTLLIIFGAGALLGIVLLYWTGSKWMAAKNEFDKAAAERLRLESLDPFPNNANYEKMKVHIANYAVALDKFKEELKKEMVPEAPLAPNEFQSRLRQASIVTGNRARANNVKLPDNFRLGFDEFATTLPKANLTPLLGQELSQVQMLLNILLDAKVDSVTALHRNPLPEEREVKPTAPPTPAAARPGRKGASAPTAKAAQTKPAETKLFERNVVDLTFKAPPSAARKVLNEISSSTGQFFIVRTLYVHNEKDKGPPREKGAEPAPPPAAPAEGEQAAPAQQGTTGPLNFIVGNEHIEVSARVEMLRFTF